MSLYVGVAISEYINQEGYVAKVLDELVNSGVAVNGLRNFISPRDNDKPSLMYIAYDIKGNTYIIFDDFYREEVDFEIARKNLFSLRSICSKDIKVLIDEMDKGRLHEEIQKNGKIPKNFYP